MSHYNILIKPASSLCNLRCRYCFYHDVAGMRDVSSYGIMSSESADIILKNIASHLKIGNSVQFTFQGGEPTLAELDFFRYFTDKAQRLMPDIKLNLALQTNGTNLDDEWCKFLKEHNFLVGISFDILPTYHNDTRPDTQGNSTYDKVLHAIGLLERHKVEHNVLSTLTYDLANVAENIWQELCRLDIKYVQFTPCIGPLDGSPSSYALSPKQFAKFYKSIFPLWYEAYKNGKYRSIKLFDDIVNLIVYGVPTSCGINGKCTPQIVIEADGSVYPCDFYCIDEYYLGNLCTQSLTEVISSPALSLFLNRKRTNPSLCDKCKYKLFCGGNCPRMQKEICVGSDEEYCGYADLMNSHGQDFISIANEQRMLIIKEKSEG